MVQTYEGNIIHGSVQRLMETYTKTQNAKECRACCHAKNKNRGKNK